MDYSESAGFKIRKYPMEATEDAMKYLDIPNDAQWWLGHVRLATHGTAAYPGNNHPILHKRWGVVHNGIIRNYEAILNKTGRALRHTEVDSEAIPAAVNKWGVKSGLRAMKGDMAVALVKRTKPDTIYLARGEARPLYIGVSESGAIYFASERHILMKLWRTIKFGDKKTDFKWKAEPYEVKENHLVVVKDGVLQSCRPFRTTPQHSTNHHKGGHYRYNSNDGSWSREDERGYQDWLASRDAAAGREHRTVGSEAGGSQKAGPLKQAATGATPATKPQHCSTVTRHVGGVKDQKSSTTTPTSTCSSGTPKSKEEPPHPFGIAPGDERLAGYL